MTDEAVPDNLDTPDPDSADFDQAVFDLEAEAVPAEERRRQLRELLADKGLIPAGETSTKSWSAEDEQKHPREHGRFAPKRLKEMSDAELKEMAAGPGPKPLGLARELAKRGLGGETKAPVAQPNPEELERTRAIREKRQDGSSTKTA